MLDGRLQIFSEDFRRLPEISEDFRKFSACRIISVFFFLHFSVLFLSQFSKEFPIFNKGDMNLYFDH